MKKGCGWRRAGETIGYKDMIIERRCEVGQKRGKIKGSLDDG